MTSFRIPNLAVSASLTIGCADPGDVGSVFDTDNGPGTTTSTTTSSGGSDAASDDGSTGGTAGSTGPGPTNGTSGGGQKFDVGDDGPPPGRCDPALDPDCGCTFVDILFVIDNSGSMLQHQQNMAAAFPEFIDVIVDVLPPGTDLHVGITTQGGFWTGSGSGSWNQPSPGCVSDASPYPNAFTPPDQGMNGDNGDQGRLYEHDGQRFFAMNTSDDPGPLEAWFSAAATLPQASSPQQDQVEMLSAAGAYAFHPANETANSGFLRDEGAVLLIYFLTDTADITPTDAETLADIVRNAKSGCGGDACILAGGMINEDHFCYPDYPRLTEFINAFGKPAVATGQIESGTFPMTTPASVVDHKEVLGDALADVVAQTCAEIPPPEG